MNNGNWSQSEPPIPERSSLSRDTALPWECSLRQRARDDLFAWAGQTQLDVMATPFNSEIRRRKLLNSTHHTILGIGSKDILRSFIELDVSTKVADLIINAQRLHQIPDRISMEVISDVALLVGQGNYKFPLSWNSPPT